MQTICAQCQQPAPLVLTSGSLDVYVCAGCEIVILDIAGRDRQLIYARDASLADGRSALQHPQDYLREAYKRMLESWSSAAEPARLEDLQDQVMNLVTRTDEGVARAVVVGLIGAAHYFSKQDDSEDTLEQLLLAAISALGTRAGSSQNCE